VFRDRPGFLPGVGCSQSRAATAVPPRPRDRKITGPVYDRLVSKLLAYEAQFRTADFAGLALSRRDILQGSWGTSKRALSVCFSRWFASFCE